jgi:hypothetical protein
MAVGMEGLEPSRLAAHDPKSCLSASSSTSPDNLKLYHRHLTGNKERLSFVLCFYKTLIHLVFLLLFHNPNNPGYNQAQLTFTGRFVLSRVINPEGSGKLRTQLTRSVVLALRELMRQTEPNALSRDLAAYISMALQEVSQTVEDSVAAWEKKGYWVKADRFRMDWDWSQRYATTLRKALIDEDWAAVAMTSAQIGQKLMNVDVPVRHRLGEPWVGSWKKLTQTKTAG